MTTLYRPVLIETAEQAEALPEGTVALALPGQPVGSIAHRCGCGDRSCRWLDEGRGRTSKHVVGWSALVPIEAEEVRVVASGGLERDQHGATVINHTPAGPRRDYRRTEFHTPWEVAP